MRGAVARFFRSEWAVCALAYGAVFLLFFRANWAFTIRRLSDENSYLGWIDFFLGTFLSGDPLAAPMKKNFYAPGAPLAFLPAGFVARAVSVFLPVDPIAWRWAFVGAFSSLLWIVCFYLMIRVAEDLEFIPPKPPGERRGLRAYAIAFALLACTQIFHFAFQRPLMAHTVELATALASLHFALVGRFRLAFGFAVALALTRYNDLPIFLVVLGRYADTRPGGLGSQTALGFFRRHPDLSAASLGISVWIGYLAFVKGYGGYTFTDLFLGFSIWDAYRFFFGLDWGLIWLLPFWWWAFLVGVVHFPRLSWAARASVVWMLAEGLVCLLWGTNGGSFGLRYLVGSSLGAMLVGSEWIRQRPERARRFLALVSANAVWLLFLTFVFWSVEYTTFVDNRFFIPESFEAIFDPAFLAESFGRSPIATTLEFLRSDLRPGGSLVVRGDFVDLRYEGCLVVGGMLATVLAYAGVFLYTRTRNGKMRAHVS